MNRCRRILAAALAAVMLLALTACGQSADTNNSAEQTVVRIGTPAVTTRGFGAPEMLRIAEFIWQAATDFDNKANDIRRNVRDICANFPIY